MIADEVGVTKSAVHHHFRTREELFNAAIEPVIGEVRVAVEAAEGQRSVRARAERMLTGFVDIVVRHRMLGAMLAGDPGAVEMLRSHAELSDLVDRQFRLIAAVDPGVGGWIKAEMVMAGIAGGMSTRTRGVDDDVLRRHLVEASRRTLGLRTPRCLLPR
jgi:AcrR family transcriptional regulator